MQTDNQQMQINIDAQTGVLLSLFAKQQERSISNTAADLIREALELHEDMEMSALADARLKSTKTWVSHEDAWS